MMSCDSHVYCLHPRIHDKPIAKEFYQKLRTVRDMLGLSYRFEMLYDDGSQYLSVSNHFYRRLSLWGGKKQRVNGMTKVEAQQEGGSHNVMSYKELENLPCLVVLAGEMRASLSFPRYVCV